MFRNPDRHATRRAFLKQATVLTAGLASASGGWAGSSDSGGSSSLKGASSGAGDEPWYRRAVRWGQTNIAEIDPDRYDIGWWRGYWKRTRTQGVIINAGGIVAYYPTRIPLHHQAENLKGRDLFGELCRAAHEDGLAVFARMDSSKAHADFYQAHPDWFAVDAEGHPHKARDFFVGCVNSPYYEQHIPAILREIIERYHPEGFTDNSWSGLGRGSPCFCQNCQKKFRARTGQDLPRERNWNQALFREWIRWNYERRLELWELNNRITREAGGPHCLWVGMNSGSIAGQAQSFRDYREICRRTEIIMLDHQSRSDAGGFQNNGETGKLVHGLLGWEKRIPESMALYQAGSPTFRFTSKPEPEARLWMLEGIAGGLQPWWHHIGAYHEDRRMYHTAEPVCRWHEANQQYLLDRRPVATVGVVWSQQNTDFYGRDDPELLVELPWRGMTQALIRARIPYLPVHAEDLSRDAGQFSLLVLPNLAAVSDAQVSLIRSFVERGGNLLATGQSSLFNEWGEARADFGLGDLFGAHAGQAHHEDSEATRRGRAAETAHTYLRLEPELRAEVDGPHNATEPKIAGTRHPVLRGFEETDILPFGGWLESLDPDPRAQVLMTFIPPFPVFPPEDVWMREPKTNTPGLILNTMPGGSRIAFLPADLDRRFGRDNLPDHGNLLANLVRWLCKDDVPLAVEGPGLIDCHLYRQPGRLILHLINLTNAGTWRQPVEELLTVGPLRVRVRLPKNTRDTRVRSLVSSKTIRAAVSRGWASFTIDSIVDHEVLVLS
jgi:hypothetical protein